MTSDIKHTQLTRVGYSYQDLWCIKILIDWYHNPDLYQWMTVEDSESGPHKFKGLDDVVALNAEGKYELYQVKFTIDSERKDLSLSLGWLLKKKDKGTSLIQKWNTDFKNYYDNGLLAKALLITNRAPDDIIANALTNELIDLRKIPTEYLSRIYEQLGGKKEADEFFNHFKFQHSQPKINNLEVLLRDSLVPDHTTDEGWYRFKEAVERWATTKNQPAPNGRIQLSHLKDLFNISISQSLSQFFEIPNGYLPPTDDFHRAILDKTKESGALVISGRPGMGKSTYLSHLTNALVEEGVPVLRHHYSILSQGEVDRVSFTNVARSILFQINIIFPNLIDASNPNPNDLSIWLKIASDKACTNNKRLVLIIDGLDHVSRERSGDINQLNHLVNIVNKLKDKISIIYGTQPISSEKLPTIMEVDTPRDTHWFELPAMDMHAIRSWLENLVANGQINVVGENEYQSSELSAITTAFYKISSGYPLYLIYSIRELAKTKNYIIAYDVERLPPCPDGDILKYYDVLWSSLSAQAREVLLQIACVEFSWPDRDSLATCFKDALDFTKAFDEIRHLFVIRSSGITPFHSSIIVYLKNKEEFALQSKSLIKRAKLWLDTDAPDYWRWGWQWIIDSYLDDPEPLIKGVNRNWLIDSVCKGYPNSQIERILYFAEKLAFQHARYPDLIKFRLIKMRHLDGPEFQIQDFPEFLKIAVEKPQADYAMLWRIDNLHMSSNQNISMIASYSKNNPSILQRCFDELIKRIKFYSMSGDDHQGITINTLVDSAFDCLLEPKNPDIEKVFWLLSKLNEKKDSFHKIINKLVSSGNSDVILDFPINSIPEDALNMYWNNFVLACCDSDISFLDRPERVQAIQSIYGSVIAILEDTNSQIDLAQFSKPEPITSFEYMPYERYVRLFFYHLAHSLSQPKANYKLPDFTHSNITTFPTGADKFFEYTAFNIANKLLSSKKIDIFDIYELIKAFNFPQRIDCNNDKVQIWHTVSKALTQISIILYRLFDSTNRIVPLSESSFDNIATNNLWLAQNWLQAASEHGITDAVPKKVVEQAIQKAFEELKLRKDHTNYLANDSLEITKLASLYNLDNETALGLRNTAQHIYGYGWRKDITLHDVYEAIDACAEYDVGDIKDWLSRLTPFTTDIFEYSEKENRHIPSWRIKLIAQYVPKRLADEFEYHITEHNWSLCQDVLDQFIVNFPFNSIAEEALLLSQTTYNSLKQLKLKASINPALSNILNEQLAFLGGFPPAPRSNDYDSLDSDKPIDIDITKYPPKRLNDLCDELKAKNIYFTDDFITGWIDYWKDQNQAFEIIEAYEKLLKLEDNFPDSLRRSLDTVFLISCKLRGPKKSYPIAVRSVHMNKLWSRFWGGQDTILIYAEKYKRSWQQFLNDTLSSNFSETGGSEWFHVPTYELVKFFLVVGEDDLAVATTESMIKCLEDETSHLSLTPLYWQQQELAIEQVPSHILLWYYKWPDRITRLRTAHQIARLLENDVSFRPLFLQHLSQLQYEIDITDYLSILLLINEKNYNFEELTSAIMYPSLLSNNILRQLGLPAEKIDSTSYTDRNANKAYSHSDSFNKVQDGLAPLYLNFLQVLSDELNYPLLSHCEFEWECIQDRQDFIYFNYYGFCNDHFYPSDKLVFSITTQAEMIILSAYLRTLSYAYHCLGLSNSKASFFTNQVKPFGTPYTSLQPSGPPTGWPKLAEIKKNDVLPDKIELAKYLQDLIDQEEKTLFGSGPVIRTINGVCIDMELQVFQSSKTISLTAKEIFSAVETDSGSEIGIHPFSIRAHPLNVELGRFEVNYISRGIETPSFTIGYPSAVIKTTSNSVDYYFGDVLNARYKIWHYHWYPAHYAGLGPAMGAYLIVSKDVWDVLRGRSENSIYMLGKLTIIDKRNYNRDDDPIEVYNMVKI